MCKLLVSALVSLLLLTTSSQAQHEAETTNSEAAKTKATPPCALPLEDLHHSIEEIFPENYTVYLNCISFDGKGALRTAIASGELTGEVDMRYIVECRGDILVAQSLAVSGSLDRTSMETGCVECSSTAIVSCVNECAPECERCYNNTDTCTRCTACTSVQAEECRYASGHTLACAAQCPSSVVDPSIIAYAINHEEYNYCECAPPYIKNLIEYLLPREGAEEEEVECGKEGEEGEEPAPPPSSCDASCRLPGHDRNNDTLTCYACGIAYCVRCARGQDGARDRCTVCMPETVLYVENGVTECFACPEAPFAHEANIQEEELLEEEEIQLERTIALAISLPVVSVLIIIFFVSMSVFAHHRYPHINNHGRKRHRRPPTGRSNSPEGISADEQISHVWKPRPTIVLR